MRIESAQQTRTRVHVTEVVNIRCVQWSSRLGFNVIHFSTAILSIQENGMRVHTRGTTMVYFETFDRTVFALTGFLLRSGYNVISSSIRCVGFAIVSLIKNVFPIPGLSRKENKS